MTKLVSITFAKDKRKNHVFNFYNGTECEMKVAVPGRDTLDHQGTIEELNDAWFSSPTNSEDEDNY